MKCWLYYIIYVLAHYTRAHLVVLEQPEKSISVVSLSENLKEDALDTLANSEGSGEMANEFEALGENNDKANDSEENDDAADENDNDVDAPPKFLTIKHEEPDKARKIRHWNKWVSEIVAGDPTQIMGSNPHTYQPDAYPDLNRRFVLQYPYKEGEHQGGTNLEVAPDNKEIVPIEAPEEIVTLVAKESAKRVASQPQDPQQDVPEKKLLRSGDFWNGVWKEEVNPKVSLRSSNDPALGVIKAKIMPGNEFYDVIAKMKKISPRLLYIINEKDERDD